MFDNVNWNGIINNVISYIEKDWKYLIIKVDISRTSFSADFYYSKNGNEFIRLYDAIEKEKVQIIFNNTNSELEKISDKFKEYKNIRMFLTIKADKSGNVKILYRNINEGINLPWDESRKYLKLNENDKTNW